MSGTGIDHGLPRTALQVAMLMQQLGHSNNAVLFGHSADPSGIKIIWSGAKGGAWMVRIRPALIQ